MEKRFWQVTLLNQVRPTMILRWRVTEQTAIQLEFPSQAVAKSSNRHHSFRAEILLEHRSNGSKMPELRFVLWLCDGDKASKYFHGQEMTHNVRADPAQLELTMKDNEG